MGSGSYRVPDAINHPTQGLIIIDESEFQRLTQKNVIAIQQVSITSGVWNTKTVFRVPNRGIASELRLHTTLLFTTAGTVLGNVKFPYGFYKNVRVRANSTDLVNCSGIDLHVLRQIFANIGATSTGVEATTISGGAGIKTITFVHIVPLSTDPSTLKGAVFMETDDTYMEVELSTETEGELLQTTGNTAVTAVVNPVLTTYDVPHVQTSKGDAVVIPPMDVYHMLGQRDQALTAGMTTIRQPVSRANGQLLRLLGNYYWTANKTYADPNASFGGARLQYGQNQVLRDHRPFRDLGIINQMYYEGALPSNYWCFDFLSDNPFRDVLVPDAVLDMEQVIDPGTYTIVTGDNLHSCEQVLVKSPAWERAQPVDMAA